MEQGLGQGVGLLKKNLKSFYLNLTGNWTRGDQYRGIIFSRRFKGQIHDTVNSILAYYTVKSRSSSAKSQQKLGKNKAKLG